MVPDCEAVGKSRVTCLLAKWNERRKAFPSGMAAPARSRHTKKLAICTKQERRHTCGPRLISELSGAAKRMVSGRSPTWVANYDGVRVLLEYLRQCLGRPQIPEMTEHLSRYFKHCRRKAQESMNDYITRKAEAYLRAEQALQRVVASQKKKAKASKTSSQTGESHHAPDSWGWYSSRRNSLESSNDGAVDDNDQEPADGADEQADTASARDTWQDWRSYSSSRSWYGGYYDSYTYAGTWGRWPDAWHQGSWGQKPAKPLVPKVELLPSFVQGWYLLQDANLNQTERNMVQTALGGCYDVDQVAQELRNQWSDHEVRHRDQGRQTGYLREALSESEGHEEDESSAAWMAKPELDAEGQAAMEAAEVDAQEAMAAITAGKRTLREARFRQHQVKLGRQYYRSGPKGGGPSSGTSSHRGGSSSSNNDANMTCLKCGKLGHRAANCKETTNKALNVDEEQTEQAPFVCFSDQGAVGYAVVEESAFYGEDAMTTADAVRGGYMLSSMEAPLALWPQCMLWSV